MFGCVKYLFYIDARFRAADRVKPYSQRFTAMRVDRRLVSARATVLVPAEDDDFDRLTSVDILLFSFDGRFLPFVVPMPPL